MAKISLYNTLSRQKEEFHPIHPGEARVYACGPTVYGYAHIGNLRAFVFADLLNRALRSSGLDVRLIMNITDVGHLVGDGDEGEDKMLVAMRREGKSAYEIAAFYEKAFLDDIDKLNIIRAQEYPRATEHIEEQIEMVRQLEENGYTYQTSDGVYFDTSKLKAYGRLSGQLASEKKAGARVEMGEKRHATDFALWKLSPLGEQRDMEWDSPWGKGFPGWHLECSAMSVKYLGVPFDIHTGGVDHIAVHHENELAQTEGALGKLEAKVWMHSEFLTFDGGKMSKSLGNTYTIDDLAAKNFDPLALRYFFLGAHYRSKLNFTWEALGAAQNALKKLWSRARELPSEGPVDLTSLERFMSAVEDDLGTPQAIAVMWEMLESGMGAEKLAGTLREMDAVLGLGIAERLGQKADVPDEVMALAKEREAAREAKDWEASDRLRDEIERRGFMVEDTDDGQRLVVSE